MAYKMPVRIQIPEQYRHKYKGNVENIWSRSSWETKVLLFLLKRKDVLEVSSEEIIVWYKKPTDGKNHRYYPDFYVKYTNKKGTIKTCLIEVKPFKQTQPPKMSKTKTGRKSKKREQRFKNEMITYFINIAKWKAAKLFCKNNNMKFFILTDDPNCNFKYEERWKMWKSHELVRELRNG